MDGGWLVIAAAVAVVTALAASVSAAALAATIDTAAVRVHRSAYLSSDAAARGRVRSSTVAAALSNASSPSSSSWTKRRAARTGGAAIGKLRDLTPMFGRYILLYKSNILNVEGVGRYRNFYL